MKKCYHLGETIRIGKSLIVNRKVMPVTGKQLKCIGGAVTSLGTWELGTTT